MSAIVPYRRSGIRRGASSVAQFAAGGVAVDVRVERVDRRNRCIWYALKLASRDFEVTGRLVGQGRGHAVDELGSVIVAAGSMSSARFAVTTPRRGAYEAMYLEVRSDEMMLRVEAPRPPASRGLGPVKAGAALFALGLGISAIAAVPIALPRGVTLGAPASAIAGTRVHLPYAASGLGTSAYTATADDGTVLADATLVSASGEIVFALPSRLAAHRVSVNLTTRGVLGSASRTASFVVARPQPALAPAQVARVLTFSARRDATPDGETVLASYLAVGERGTIALLDEAGTVVRSVPFGRVGTTRITVPPAYRKLPLMAQIVVHRGETRAVASVAVPPSVVVPDPLADPAAPAAADSAPGEAATPIDTASLTQAGGIVAVEGHAVSGRPLVLRVAPQPAPMQIELEDDAGTVLAETRVAPGATHAVLSLPPSTTRTSYLVALHYTRNGGEETVIRTVVASPH